MREDVDKKIDEWKICHKAKSVVDGIEILRL